MARAVVPHGIASHAYISECRSPIHQSSLVVCFEGICEEDVSSLLATQRWSYEHAPWFYDAESAFNKGVLDDPIRMPISKSLSVAKVVSYSKCTSITSFRYKNYIILATRFRI